MLKMNVKISIEMDCGHCVRAHSVLLEFKLKQIVEVKLLSSFMYGLWRDTCAQEYVRVCVCIWCGIIDSNRAAALTMETKDRPIIIFKHFRISIHSIEIHVCNFTISQSHSL